MIYFLANSFGTVILSPVVWLLPLKLGFYSYTRLTGSTATTAIRIAYNCNGHYDNKHVLQTEIVYYRASLISVLDSGNKKMDLVQSGY